MTIRAIGNFKRRNAYGPFFNVAVAGFLLLAILIVSILAGEKSEMCFGIMVFYASSLQLHDLVITALSVMLSLFVLMSGIIWIQLMKNGHIDPHERVAASRTFYYLLLAIVIHVSN